MTGTRVSSASTLNPGASSVTIQLTPGSETVSRPPCWRERLPQSCAGQDQGREYQATDSEEDRPAQTDPHHQ